MSSTLFNGSYIGRKNTGIGVVAKNLALSLSADSVVLLDPINIGRKGSIEIPSNLSPDNGFKGHLRRLYWMQKRVPSLMNKEGFELFLSPLPEAPLFSSVRSIVLAHDLIPLRYPQLNFSLAYFSLYVPSVLHHAEIVLCNSEATARELNSFFKVPVSKLAPIRLGINSKKLFPMNLPREDFFLILGRHNPHKNLSRVLKAFSILKSKDYQMVFVGPFDQRYTPELKAIANELEISDKCIWIDWVNDDEKLSLLNKCKALLIPSLWEGFGLPALEAMACGSPVIASNRGALPEVVAKFALMINPLNCESIASAMKEICTNNNIHDRANIEGPMYASLFSWENTANQVEDIIKTLS